MKAMVLKDRKLIATLAWRVIKWHINYLCTKTPMPLACGFYITNRCNFRCGFCNIWRKSTAQTISFEKARHIVNGLSNMGCFYFSITGGEPLLIDYLFDLLTYVRKTRIKYIHVVTNGFLLDIDKAKKFATTGINEISLSIDGEEALHDENRGVLGAYKRALKAVENLKKYAPEVKIVLNTIFFPGDPFACLHVVELAKKLDVYVKIQPLNQHPVFNQNNYDYVKRSNFSAQDIKKVVSILQKEERVISSRLFLDNLYNFFCRKEALIFNKASCLFGYHHLEVLEDASVFPCLEGLGWKEGRGIKGDLKALLKSHDYRQLVTGLKNCDGCKNNYYICYYEPRINFPLNNFIRSLQYQ